MKIVIMVARYTKRGVDKTKAMARKGT